MTALTLEGHPITRDLKELGLTDEELERTHFWKHGDHVAFSLWPITFAWSIPKGLLHKLKAYCALKWLLNNDPPPSLQRDEANRLVSEAEAWLLAQPVFEAQARFLQAQRVRAQAPRGITHDGRDMKTLVADFCRKPENREAPAPELWPKFLHELHDAGLEAEDRDGIYRYWTADGRKKTVAFSSFANLVTKARRRSSH